MHHRFLMVDCKSLEVRHVRQHMITLAVMHHGAEIKLWPSWEVANFCRLCFRESQDPCCVQHISLAINEELDLQARLLDDLDEDVEVSHSKLRAASKRLRSVMQRSGSCKCTCLIILLGAILVVVVVLALKVVI